MEVLLPKREGGALWVDRKGVAGISLIASIFNVYKYICGNRSHSALEKYSHSTYDRRVSEASEVEENLRVGERLRWWNQERRCKQFPLLLFLLSKPRVEELRSEFSPLSMRLHTGGFGNKLACVT